MTAEVGGNTTLPCWTSLPIPVDWYYFPPESERGQFVCSAGNILNGFRRRITLERSAPGDYSLTIVNVTREDAGLYICQEEAGLGLKHRIYLNVQGKMNIPMFSYTVSKLMLIVHYAMKCHITIQNDINLSQVICVVMSVCKTVS